MYWAASYQSLRCHSNKRFWTSRTFQVRMMDVPSFFCQEILHIVYRSTKWPDANDVRLWRSSFR